MRNCICHENESWILWYKLEKKTHARVDLQRSPLFSSSSFALNTAYRRPFFVIVWIIDDVSTSPFVDAFYACTVKYNMQIRIRYLYFVVFYIAASVRVTGYIITVTLHRL